MQVEEFKFKSREEAKAFKQGIEYANDSALLVSRIRKRKQYYVVIVHDRDKNPDIPWDGSIPNYI